MGLSISEEDSKRIWGKSFTKRVKLERKEVLRKDKNKYVDDKVLIAKEKLKYVLLFKLVKFVGISGSVSAGFPKREDDIDLFVVVRDGSMWLYRAVISFRNIFHHSIRTKRTKDVSDKLCLNLICEERGLQFESDIFNFHELMYLYPIYNEKYLNYIYSQNQWLVTKYNVKKENLESRIQSEKQSSIFVRSLNAILFYLQLLFMIVMRHSPDIKGLVKDSKKGKIQFFPRDFKKEIVMNYLRRFKSTN